MNKIMNKLIPIGLYIVTCFAAYINAFTAQKGWLIVNLVTFGLVAFGSYCEGRRDGLNCTNDLFRKAVNKKTLDRSPWDRVQ